MKTRERTPKRFDCVDMKRRIQRKMHRDTRSLPPDELLAYFRRRVSQSRFAPLLNGRD
jgi:hypothetical protein